MEIDDQVAADAQEISNELADAAYWVRADPSDVRAVTSRVERALERLRALEAAAELELAGK